MDQRWSRRDILVLGAAGFVAACTGGSSDEVGRIAAPSDPGRTSTGPTAQDLPPYEPTPDFPEGILSGDPASDSVVLWTRPSPELVATGEDLVVELATTPSFAEIVTSAQARPDATREGSTKFVIDSLEPGSSYLYRFRIGDAVSPIGLTHTAPAPGTSVDGLRLAVFSCQRYSHGFYPAHDDLAAQAPDLVISLGDYVYETGEADDVEVDGRIDPIADARTVEDFRRKYELYRSDVALQKMHRVSPIVAIPDNHDGSHRPDDAKYPGAHQAFFEKMPVREDPDDPMRTHRRITWGDLVDIWMLDTERFRTTTPRGLPDTDLDTTMMDPEATYLGPAQREWLFDGLAQSTARWKVLGSARQFSPLRLRAGDGSVPNGGTYANLSQWDGYQAERMAILDEVERLGLTSVVVVSGDMHWFWAAEVPRDFDDPTAPPVVVDFLCGGISSSNADERIGDGGPQTASLLEAFGPANEQYVRYFDGDRHGYGLLDFAATAAEVSYRSPTTILEPDAPSEELARFRLDPDRAGITRVLPEAWPEST